MSSSHYPAKHFLEPRRTHFQANLSKPFMILKFGQGFLEIQGVQKD